MTKEPPGLQHIDDLAIRYCNARRETRMLISSFL